MRFQEKTWRATKLDYASIIGMPELVTGVYVIWCPKTKVCIYVGKAEKNPIKKRLKDHWRGSHNESLNLWLRAINHDDIEVCYRHTKDSRIDYLEKRLIHLWKPEANKRDNPNTTKGERGNV